MDCKTICSFFKMPCGSSDQSLLGNSNQGSTPLSWKAQQCTVGTIGILGIILIGGGAAGLLSKAALATLGVGITGLTGLNCVVGTCVKKHLMLDKAVNDLENQTGHTGDAVLHESELLTRTETIDKAQYDALQGEFTKVKSQLAEIQTNMSQRSKEIESLKAIITKLTDKLTSMSVSYKSVLDSLASTGETSQQIAQAHAGMLTNIQEIQQLLPQLATIEELPKALDAIDKKFDDNFVQVQGAVKQSGQALRDEIAKLKDANDALQKIADSIGKSAQAIDDRDDKELEVANRFHKDVEKDEEISRQRGEDLKQLRAAVEDMQKVVAGATSSSSSSIPMPSSSATQPSGNDKDLDAELFEVSQLVASLKTQTSALNDLNQETK